MSCPSPNPRPGQLRDEPPSDEALFLAMAELCLFVREMADEAASELGFGYRADPNAPATYEALEAAVARSLETKEPLAVSTAHVGSAVVVGSDVSYALAFWHAIAHVRLGLTFSPRDEREVARYQLTALSV